MLPEEDVRLKLKDLSMTLNVDTVIMSLGTSPNPLISSTTKGLETNRRKCIVAEEENGQTSKEGVYRWWRCCYRSCYSYPCYGSW